MGRRRLGRDMDVRAGMSGADNKVDKVFWKDVIIMYYKIVVSKGVRDPFMSTLLHHEPRFLTGYSLVIFISKQDDK